jgi:hypothetical protein
MSCAKRSVKSRQLSVSFSMHSTRLTVKPTVKFTLHSVHRQLQWLQQSMNFALPRLSWREFTMLKYALNLLPAWQKFTVKLSSLSWQRRCR